MMLADVIAQLDAFRPDARDDNWRALDIHVQALLAADESLAPALPALLRVFERFPRHDGHGVFWTILHAIEGIPGYEPALVEAARRAPTSMTLTMLQRLVTTGVTHVETVELAPLIASLTPRAPLIDYTIAPVGVAAAPPTLTHGRDLATLLAALEAFHPPLADDVDWQPLLALLDELFSRRDDLHAAIPRLLATLDRFRPYDGFAGFWRIVNALEALPYFPSELVAALQRTPSASGVTLLLRVLAREITTVDGVDVAALAARLLETS